MSMTVREVTIEQRKGMAFGMANYWQEKLGLGHWDIQVSFELHPKMLEEVESAEGKKHDEDNYGYAYLGWCITPFSGEWARIFFNPKILDFTDQQIEMLVVHELLHCITHQIDEFVENAIEAFMPKSAYEFVWNKEYDRHAEIVVDHLALSYVRLRQSLANDQIWDWTMYA